MDANGLKFWMLADAGDWNTWGNPAPLQYDGVRRSLRLASERLLPLSIANPADDEADPLLERVPSSVDPWGTFASWDAGRKAVVASGARDGDTVIVDLSGGGCRPTSPLV